jgi:two-component system, chemotaxis family, chemotaxis protein CheY
MNEPEAFPELTPVGMLAGEQFEAPPAGLARFVLIRAWRSQKLIPDRLVLLDTRPPPPILVVEDDREQREALCAMLDLEGFEHAQVSNGREALAYLNESGAPCVVLLDLEMPVMNGRVFRAKQLADERLSRIPVVIVTGNAEGVGTAFPGVAGFLWKPLKFEKLATVLDGVCKRRKGFPATKVAAG